ncbi:predicted protein [Histoplasma capsulatum G186AR]|uniref:Uncharacterized protein n=1 Tax=Ajellomyces capsulatus (strain G186AR / H82 / ATCC MYA-2454 / RMSCC 2432) TaxID=447093 RepID=C0NAX5_AJECG|nr:uncharacterized protein HCBG_00271 [Histoplasma capsulatum G186AR]EEH10816.1 predicted protein [Histoplasma capsulatum G186AR]
MQKKQQTHAAGRIHIKLDSRSSAAARERRQRRYVEKMLRSWQAALRRRLQSSAVQRPVGNKYAPALSEAQSGNASVVPAVRDVLSIPYGYFAMSWVFVQRDAALNRVWDAEIKSSSKCGELQEERQGDWDWESTDSTQGF